MTHQFITHPSRPRSFANWALLFSTCAISLVGCGDVSPEDSDGEAPVATGGLFTSGGNFSSGGSDMGSSGGAASTGSAASSGGALITGGETATGSGGAESTGGAAATGGNAATGGTSGTGGSPGSDCDVEPANSNSNQATRKVLCFLHEIYKESVLSGQQDCHWSASSDLQYINTRTGKYPAVVGGDFLYDNAVSQATNSWNAGGLSMIRYHMGRPEDADSYESSLGTTDLAATLTPGSSRYNGLMSKFDHAASELTKLQNAGVVVIWAPFHEVQPGGWFWWSKGTGAQLKQLWQLMFDNFKARGLNNLIWLFPFSGEPNSSFYPGENFVDIAGPDTYASGQPFAPMYQSTVGVVGSSIPIPLHETGTVPDPAAMFNNNQAPWLLFSTWCDTYLRDNSDSALQTAYSHARTLNRGDLPSFD